MPKKRKIKIIIYSILLVLAVALLIGWFFYNSVKSRDYERLGDMRVLESEINSYFFKFNTYKIPECSEGMLINFCTGRGDKTLNVSNIIDPVNSNNLRYILVQMTNDNFRVEFYLEGSLVGLPSGKYALTKEGLGR
ncbi:MAG: hypothetical protein AAB969_02040 [Patescibacteria group bacterium]